MKKALLIAAAMAAVALVIHSRIERIQVLSLGDLCEKGIHLDVVEDEVGSDD
jgi:hypothetical protein